MGKAPTPQAPPPKPAPLPMEISGEAVQKARVSEAKKKSEQQGRQSTLLTSPVGLDKKTKIGIQ